MPQGVDFGKGKRGAIALPVRGKTRITIRLDDEVLNWFRAQVHAAGGGNYQSLINLALREHIKRSAEPLEQTLRRVLREEFRGRPAHLTGSVRPKGHRRMSVTGKKVIAR